MTAAAEGSPPLRMARARRSPLLQSEAVQGIALISPTFLYALILLVLPILVVIAHSFWTQDYLTIDHTFTLENYRIALTEPIYRDLLWRSLYISLTVSLLTVLLAYPIAYFISFHGGRQKSLWLFLITIPFWTSYLLRVMSWKVILGYNGVLNSGLMGLGLIDEPSTALLYNSNAVIITLTHAWATFAILPIFVSLEKVDRTLVEAATDLGDGPLRSLLRVTLPLSAPGVISAALIVMIPTVGDYVTPKLVGGKDGVMIANAIQAQFGKASNWPLGAALSVTTMVIVSLMAGAAVLVIRALQRLAR
ncbi:MAG: ABC transporter permease subunit [Mesorhizobium sp.]|uniref:ABC transporter permease n=1 Tax=unclassified Mesorhizobium TaxID=325217 RepID=UPI000F74C99F|nr:MULTISPECIES: ABC transporter permease [unclassified Mesorhizobium]TGV85976.1 ABC transporter permease [Mesorhizobium sp. M00.F.Ca.ET.158.01.1.1]AZO60943.1 ABC transporter permease [Mesorhizobium sp. M1A.F.Ca.IN.022.06.1.1]MCT2576647.1 ABC transporter permease [Mesorhizobium sp. P13.3]MDF3165585.1 ABC transporter permease [Mesorhizobium sp. P16.1]MDF3176215.1 ABC transporter permease [Mesorhizobium sp. P17.1]